MRITFISSDARYLRRIRSLISGASTRNPATTTSFLAWAWRRLEKTHGCVPVQGVADEIGWSRQYFRDRFRDAIGVTPKSAARVFRLLLRTATSYHPG